MWNQTELTQLLRIDYPIIQAPMAGGSTTPELVAAVSNCGGLGMIGAGYMQPEQIREHIRETKKLTTRPFGINLFIPEKITVDEEKVALAQKLLEPIKQELGMESSLTNVEFSNAKDHFNTQLDIILQEGVSVCSFTFGLPTKEVVSRLKDKQIIVVGTATTVEEAKKYEQLGVDAIVIQGVEAGGHRGTFTDVPNSLIGLMSLIPQVADEITIPLIASGGIMDERGVLAARLLGAQGVQMGTAFLVTKESGAHQEHKHAITQSTEDTTVLTRSFSGKYARGLHNHFIETMKVHEEQLPDYPIQNTLTSSIRKEAGKQNNKEWMSLWCGQSPRLSRQQTVKELMTNIITRADDLLKQMNV